MIEEAILHDVETMGIREGVIRLAQVPLSREIRLVAAGLQHRSQRPFCFWQTTALALEGHGGHATAIGEAPSDHRSTSRRAAWLPIERKEGDPFLRHAIQVRRRHATTRAATIHAGITVSEVIADDDDNVGFLVCRLTRTNRAQ